MRIAILSFEFPPATAFGGISTYSAQAADLFAAAGHDVEVFAGGAAVETHRRPSGAIVHTIGCTDPMRFTLPVTWSFCRRHAEKPFAVMEAPEYLAPAFHIVQLLTELPLVLRLHTPAALITRINLPQKQWRQSPLFIARQMKNLLTALRQRQPLPSVHFANDRLLRAWEIDAQEAAVARSADLICSPSLALVSYPTTHWGIAPAKTIHLPNVYQAPAKILSLPPAENPVCLGYFGRLEVRKGIVTLAKALPLIAHRFPKTKLLFVGQSSPLEGVHADARDFMGGICRDLGLEVEFAGRQPQDKLPEWYARCQIVMLPSVWENFPYVCLEAMAAARAVIGSKAGGMADMITHGETGLLAAPGDFREFAALAILLLSNPAKCTQMGQAARASVVARYSPGVLFADYEKTYREAIGHRRQSGPRPNPWLA